MNHRWTNAAPWMAVLIMTAALYLLSSCGQSEATSAPAAEASTAESTESTGSDEATAPQIDGPPDGRPDLLSEWDQLEVSNGQLVVAEDVVPYSLNSALFSDYAHKLRTVWLPRGSDPATYDDQDVFDFPVGTVITKTFYFPLPDAALPGQVAKLAQATSAPGEPLRLDTVRLLETRVLVHRAHGWEALPYVWNEDQSDAALARVGDLINLTLVDGNDDNDGIQDGTDFPYVVPNVNQCASCHAVNHTTGVIQPIGPKARHLNRDIDADGNTVSQIDHWQDLGILASAPAEVPQAAAWEDASTPLDERARAYLDINCAHCHNSAGTADTSGLFLETTSDVGLSLGICKLPIAAGTGTGGRRVGIQPGDPDESIFVYRMETTDPGAMMPELGRSLTHVEGLDLISDWIAELDGDCQP